MNRTPLAAGLLIAAALGLSGCPSKSPGPKPLVSNPVGTGPWVFKKWVKDQKLIYEANPNYWGEKPKAKKLIMVPIKENNSRLLQLESGAAQILDGLRPADARKKASDPKIEILHQAGMAMGYLAMNNDVPPFDNPKVRKAVALAIDRRKIVELNFQGYATPAGTPVPPGLLGHVPELKATDPDIERAKALIKESGVETPIKTELWHMPIPRPYMPEPKKIAILIAESLRSIGIEAELVSKKWEIYLKETKEGKHPMCLLGWTADVADADNFLYVLLGKDNIGSTNVSRYANEEVLDLLLRAQSAIKDSERAALYRKAQEIIYAENPIVPLVYADQLMAYRKDVKGFYLHATGRKDFDTVAMSGDTIVFARGGDASRLDPALVDDGESVVSCWGVYESLVRYKRGSASELEPCLATAWTVSDDGKTYTFDLRKGVQFHDGTPFDADAVIFNFNRLIDDKNPYHDVTMQNLPLYAAIEKLEKLDSHKVRFVLSRPVASFLGNLTIYTAYIVSPTALKQGADAKN